ncbi:VOC family protein [candidate division WOR-3 bacterium]|uniref:VOC family protein n=1 Tax=candidate division WOR-3 bacterium TaxID=2052148 RepID=A0A937XI06_UNCW3|nr:VOC family protein [candidate division WOR-3 bacterium]
MPKLVHWEIPVVDMKRAQEFYEKLFGWKFQSWGEAGDYTLFDSGESTGGALMKVDKMPEPAIRVYVGVDDMPAVLDRAVALGGKVGQPKSDIGGGMGFAGSLLDPWGCLIGLWSEK